MFKAFVDRLIQVSVTLFVLMMLYTVVTVLAACSYDNKFAPSFMRKTESPVCAHARVHAQSLILPQEIDECFINQMTIDICNEEGR